jgi:hypothetical protein
VIPGKKQDFYRLTLEDRPGYFYALVQAEHEDYRIAREYWEEILDAAIDAGASRLMVEYAIGEVATMTDTFQWVSELAPRAAGARIACVDPIADHASIHKFSELVAVNRGVSAMAFDNTADAEKWLMAG